MERVFVSVTQIRAGCFIFDFFRLRKESEPKKVGPSFFSPDIVVFCVFFAWLPLTLGELDCWILWISKAQNSGGPKFWRSFWQLRVWGKGHVFEPLLIAESLQLIGSAVYPIFSSFLLLSRWRRISTARAVPSTFELLPCAARIQAGSIRYDLENRSLIGLYRDPRMTSFSS